MIRNRRCWDWRCGGLLTPKKVAAVRGGGVMSMGVLLRRGGMRSPRVVASARVRGARAWFGGLQGVNWSDRS